MNLKVIYPVSEKSSRFCELDPSQLRQRLESKPWDSQTIRLNLVSTKAGLFAGPNGSSREISNDVDRVALLSYRRVCDVIITSAKTARLEGYARSKFATLVVLSRDGNVAGIPAFDSESVGKPAILWQMSDGQLDIRAEAKRNGWNRVLLETGPTLSRSLISECQIDSLMLTISDAGSTDPKLACDAALSVIGASNASLLWAEVVSGTLLTEWDLSGCGVARLPQ